MGREGWFVVCIFKTGGILALWEGESYAES
jgi:hypothetical protein